MKLLIVEVGCNPLDVQHKQINYDGTLNSYLYDGIKEIQKQDDLVFVESRTVSGVGVLKYFHKSIGHSGKTITSYITPIEEDTITLNAS